jgi:electron transfer flavoprotein beta subunit
VLRVVALIKYTPELTGDRRLGADFTLDRAAVPGRISELDEYAVEQALQLAEKLPDTQVTFLLMGPTAGADAVRKALSMGGDGAVHICDDALHGSDAAATSAVLAAALTRIGYDLVICGMASTDANMGVVPAMLAARLGVTQLSFAGELSVDGDTVSIVRDTDAATEGVQGKLPAVVSVTDRTTEARYPSFKGIMAAKKKPLTTLTLADAGIETDKAGLAGSGSQVAEFAVRPPKAAGQIVKDEGDGGVKLADYLASQKLV